MITQHLISFSTEKMRVQFSFVRPILEYSDGVLDTCTKEPQNDI